MKQLDENADGDLSADMIFLYDLIEIRWSYSHVLKFISYLLFWKQDNKHNK